MAPRRPDPTKVDATPSSRITHEMSSYRRRLPALRVDKAIEIIEKVAGGSTLKEALSGPNMPSSTVFYNWLVKYPELRDAYEDAKKLSAQALEEKALEMAEKLADDARAPTSQARLRGIEMAMGQWRWSAERRDRARFGNTNQNQSLIVPIQINSSLNLGDGTGQGPLPQTENESIYNISVPEQGISGTKMDVVDVEPEPEAPEPAPSNPFDGLRDRLTSAKDVIYEKYPEVREAKRPGRPKMGPRKSVAMTERTRKHRETVAKRREAKKKAQEDGN